MNLQTQRDRIRASITAPSAPWYRIANTAQDRAVVRIYGEVSWLGITAEEFAADLAKITAPVIEVQINSPGGNVFDGIAIYNALRAHPARIVTRVDGLAASIASVIVQAGDERQMMGGSQLMVHRAWAACIGNDEDMAEMAKLLAKQNDVLVGIYAQRTGRPAARIRELLNAETWFTAEEAVREKLADSIGTAGNAPEARFDPSLSLALLDL